MKNNMPKRKVFNDAVDLLMADAPAVNDNGVRMLPVDEIKPFKGHPFRLYEGQRLDDMVESVREHGILVPVIVRTVKGGYEMLAGHNRMNAARIAGIKEIPAVVKENLSDPDAWVYVIETNLLQRSFSELSILFDRGEADEEVVAAFFPSSEIFGNAGVVIPLDILFPPYRNQHFVRLKRLPVVAFLVAILVCV